MDPVGRERRRRHSGDLLGPFIENPHIPYCTAGHDASVSKYVQ